MVSLSNHEGLAPLSPHAIPLPSQSRLLPLWEKVGEARMRGLWVTHHPSPDPSGTSPLMGEVGRGWRIGRGVQAENFSSLIASKSCTPPPTRLVV